MLEVKVVAAVAIILAKDGVRRSNAKNEKAIQGRGQNMVIMFIKQAQVMQVTQETTVPTQSRTMCQR